MQNSSNKNLYLKDVLWCDGNVDWDVTSYDSVAVGNNELGNTVYGVGGDLCDSSSEGATNIKYLLPVTKPETMGDPDFKKTYGVKYAYIGGAMAAGISSVEMAVKLGKAGFIAAYGTGGQDLDKIEDAIKALKRELPNGNFIINFLYNLSHQEQEKSAFELFERNGVKFLEVSAYLNTTKPLVQYRVSGFKRAENGSILITNKLLAKLSREEVAKIFMSPPTPSIVESLRKEGLITDDQALMAKQVPMADDITVEADSAGHTDNRPLVSILPAMVDLRDRIQESYNYAQRVRIGAAGGISTPQSIVGAFKMGASYVVTGSINQSCVEAGTSQYVKELLSTVTMADMTMVPGADAFEIGSKVQVVKKNTLLPMNAQKLYDLYQTYKSYEEIPENIRSRIEKNYFRLSAEEVWAKTEEYMAKTDNRRLEMAYTNPKVKMALMFKWYLGLSVIWAVYEVMDRKFDMQVMCGPSMGAFNLWVKGTPLEKAENRHVDDIAGRLMLGAAEFATDVMCADAGVPYWMLPKRNVKM